MPVRATGFWNYRRGGSSPPAPPPVFVAAPSLSPVSYVVYVGDRGGTIIGELAGMLESVSWATDGYGMASLVMPLQDALRAGPLLGFGNRVFIEFSNGLAPWGGVVDAPRETTLGQMRLQFYEAAYLLNWRLTPRMAVYTGSEARPAADVLLDLVRPSGLALSYDFAAAEGGAVGDVEFHYDTLAVAGQRLRDVGAALHYFLRPLPLGRGGIHFEMVAFRNALRDDTARAVLIQGHNLVDWAVLEQGPIHNEVVVGVGDFLDQTEDSYGAVYVAGDAGSQGRYDLRQYLIAMPEEDGESGPGRAEQRATAHLATYGRPRTRVRGACLNLAPALYRDYSIGSRVRIEASTPMATAEELTVVGMEFRPAEGVLALTFDDSELGES